MAQSLRPSIVMSLFELLKPGPGPSSSHTIGPMLAGGDFAARLQGLEPELLARAKGLRVRLFGSLAATGKGHGTDRAVLAGLMGHKPATCPPSLLNDISKLAPERRFVMAGDKALPLGLDNIYYDAVQHSFPYSNTLIIELLDRDFPQPLCRAPESGPTLFLSEKQASGSPGLPLPRFSMNEADPYADNVLFSMEYYSVGGGFLQWKGWQPQERGAPRHPYVNMTEVHMRLTESGLSLDDLLMENECAITGKSSESVRQGLDELLELMKDTVRRGCSARGFLPGAIGLARKAGVLFERAASLEAFDRKLCLLNAYAYGAAEENAAGNIIVTAPTCGAAGVAPAVLMFMQEHLGLDQAAQRRGLMAAALMGFLAKQNAGIAGAEVGCQGEVGVASAMAAAMLAHARGASPKVVENAAEITMEHHLGLTCDPVGGYVQIPCIERNALGACKAYNAALIACNENPASHLVTYDEALSAMAEIGRDMNSKYKETSTGGLAVALVLC
ncbi:L-serine ammonia-lyase, iron-sulfur-dependent, subunit alpha [Desulfovibrio sp. OttesenSCG-928-M14]|nr:L-serine ammonia-lyase, iron-sulfur-dependent, subunit alpha [Desulfovibrio sp. OttesenSCG-928-M14]